LYAGPMMVPDHAFWFGEDQARYVITIRTSDTEAVTSRAKTAGVPVRRIGSTSGSALTLPGERPILLKTLRERFEGWLPAYMTAGRGLAAAGCVGYVTQRGARGPWDKAAHALHKR